jgi:hypothetical protein
LQGRPRHEYEKPNRLLQRASNFSIPALSGAKLIAIDPDSHIYPTALIFLVTCPDSSDQWLLENGAG